MKILHLDSSPLGAASVSRGLTARVAADAKAENPGAVIVHRDLVADPIDHLSGAVLGALQADPATATDAQKAEKALTDTLIDELTSADLIVIGAPMYNFGIPTQLKSWIDRVTLAGRTFRYTETGPVGLVADRKVVIVSARGGFYAGAEFEAALDHQEAHLRAVFSLIGIKSVTVVRAEGVGYGPESRAKAVSGAEAEIDKLFARAA